MAEVVAVKNGVALPVQARVDAAKPLHEQAGAPSRGGVALAPGTPPTAAGTTSVR